MSRIFSVHKMIIYGSVQFFLRNVCYVRGFSDNMDNVQVLFKNHLVTLTIYEIYPILAYEIYPILALLTPYFASVTIKRGIIDRIIAPWSIIFVILAYSSLTYHRE